MDKLFKPYVDAIAYANKTLGSDGKLPKQRVDLLKVFDDGTKTVLALNKQREEMEKQIVEVETGLAKIKGAAKQYGDLIDGDNFGLDAKDPKNKKIIADVSKKILDALGDIENTMDEWTGMMDKLDKVLTDLHRLNK